MDMNGIERKLNKIDSILTTLESEEDENIEEIGKSIKIIREKVGL